MWKISEEMSQNRTLHVKELRDRQVNMFTTVFIGNSETKIIDGHLVTKKRISYMKRILIFFRHPEGRQLADILDASGICADVCVATEYGHEVMTEGQYRNIYTGRLTEEEMKEFMQKGDYAAIVDATHPYAVVVSSNIRQASALGRTSVLSSAADTAVGRR